MPSSITISLWARFRQQVGQRRLLTLGNNCKAGAAARGILVAAASSTWNVPEAELVVEKGIIRHTASQRQTTFGAMAAMASTLPIPADVKLKQPQDWIYIGKEVPHSDSVAKTTGAAVYAMDVKRPGMVQ